MLSGLIIGSTSLGVAGFQMYMSRSRYKKLKKVQCDQKKDLEILKNNQDRILDYLHRNFDPKIEANTKFDAIEATAKVGKRKPNKEEQEPIKPNFLLTLRRWLGKLFP